MAIARYQAARYAQTCRVFAPMYRQQTLGGLAAGGSPEALELAYSDVVEAWREYLAEHNRGRPFVLIGHSQGTRMLRRLLRDEIDPRPELRAAPRLRAAAGRERQRARRAARRRRLPERPRLHRRRAARLRHRLVDVQRDAALELPLRPRPGRGHERLRLPRRARTTRSCARTPPTSAGNERRELTTYMRSEPFPGVLGLLLVEMYGGPQPSAPTPWLRPRERYTGACERRDGANVLMLESIGDARKLNAAPDPSWGLHLADANIALGDLVQVVQGQIATLPAAKKRVAKKRVARSARPSAAAAPARKPGAPTPPVPPEERLTNARETARRRQWRP